MKANEIMKQSEQYVLHTYNRYPVVLDHGKGVRLYDGKERNIWTLPPALPFLRWDMEMRLTIRR